MINVIVFEFGCTVSLPLARTPQWSQRWWMHLNIGHTHTHRHRHMHAVYEMPSVLCYRLLFSNAQEINVGGSHTEFSATVYSRCLYRRTTECSPSFEFCDGLRKSFLLLNLVTTISLPLVIAAFNCTHFEHTLLIILFRMSDAVCESHLFWSWSPDNVCWLFFLFRLVRRFSLYFLVMEISLG